MKIIESTLLLRNQLSQLMSRQLTLKCVICLLLSSTLLFSSCLSQRAVFTNERERTKEIKQVDPRWQYEKGLAYSIPVLTIFFGSIAGGWVAGPEVYPGIPETNEEEKFNQELAGAATLGLASLIVLSTIGRSKKLKSKMDGNKPVEAKDFDKWLKKYNKSQSTTYSFMDQTFPSVTLVPVSVQRQLDQYQEECRMAISELRTNQIDWNELDRYRKISKNNYAQFFPEEVANLESAIREEETSAAYELIMQLKEDELQQNEGFTTLERISSFDRRNIELWSKIDGKAKQDIRAAFEQKTNEVLSELVEPEVRKLRSLDDVEALNSLSGEVKRKFQLYQSSPALVAFDESIKERKTELVLGMSNSLKQRINNSNFIPELDQINSVYFTNTEESTQIRSLVTDLKSRKAEIEREQKRIEMERRLAEEKAWSKLGAVTKGLRNEALIRSFIKGDFLNIPFNRDEIIFGEMITTYMYARARDCKSALPANRVMIYEDKCATEKVTKDGYGWEISRVCVEWVPVPTGLYADPEVYKAYELISKIIDRDALKNVGKLFMQMTQGNSLEPVTDLSTEVKYISLDMKDLIDINPCGGPALDRFEENLIRFANGEPPMKLDGSVERYYVDYSLEQDLDQLTRDLVSENSRSWAFRYIPNSVSNVYVASRDQQNRPQKITANYRFEGMLGTQRDQVQITFKEGIPECIYFQNYSSNCRTPDRKVVQKLVNGEYVRK